MANNMDKNIALTYTNNVTNIVTSIQNTIMDINIYRRALDIDDPNRHYIKTHLKEYRATGVFWDNHYTFINYMGHINYFNWDEYDEVVGNLNILLEQVQAFKDVVVI